MKNKKLGQEQAFPVEFKNTVGDSIVIDGMSKRLLIAKDAMCAMLANPNIKRPHPQDGDLNEQLRQFVSIAYEYADELLTQENE